MGDISLYKRAVGDYKIGMMALENYNVDETFLDQAGYHLQQSVEKALKYQIALLGEQYPYEHDIGLLIDMCDDLSVNYHNWIKDSHDVLTRYGTKTRYSSSQIASRTTLVGLYEKQKEYLGENNPKKIKNNNGVLFNERGE